MNKKIIAFIINKQITFRIIAKTNEQFPQHYLYFLNTSIEVLENQYARIL